MRKMIDMVITLDSLYLEEWETADDVVELIKKHFDVCIEPTYEVTYEETVDD